MAKFVMECPECGKFVEARKGIFAKRQLECSCGNVIDIKTDRLTSRKCPHCGNQVVFDQRKGKKAKCPVCKNPINTMEEQNKMVEFSCAQCGIRLQTAKTADTYTCPVCDHVNDVAERVATEKIRHDGLASVIKYEGDNDTFVWKHPIEDFNSGSQLIVHESQEAVFFKDGQALDLFGPGRYTLETQQLPVLEKIYKLPTDTESTFHAEVYFINKTVQMAIKWGTPDKVRFIDPLTGVPLELGASGSINLMVSDSRKLLVKLVGTMRGIAWSSYQEKEKFRTEDENGEPIYETRQGVSGFTKSLQASFRPLIANAVKTSLTPVIKNEAIDLLEIDEKVDVISAKLRDAILPGFEEYGLTIPQFYVTNIVLPEDDPNFRRIRELHTITLQTRMQQARAVVKTSEIQAEADIKTAAAQSQAQYRVAEEQSRATIESVKREADLEEETTKTEKLKREAERIIIEAQAKAQADAEKKIIEAQAEIETVAGAQAIAQKTRLTGFADAEVMAAKGYNQKDVIQADVQKAYAEGIGNMGPAISGGGGSSVIGDMLGLGVGMAAASAIAPQVGGMLNNMNTNVQGAGVQPTAGGWSCSCGATNITSKFCPDCGKPKPQPTTGSEWNCPNCGATGVTSKFCPECGSPRPVLRAEGWTCASCGATGITSKFCPECGTPKPQPVHPETWTCPNCGTTGINAKFCPECGTKRGGEQ